jgi:hypothetical protein
MAAITGRFASRSILFRQGLASAGLLALVFAATPSAAEFSLASVTSAERAACKPDVFRLCASEIPNVGRIVACMKRERSKLSPACAAVVHARLAKEKAVTKTVAKTGAKTAITTATRSLRTSID